MGFSLRRMLRNPFGRKSVFGKVSRAVVSNPLVGFAAGVVLPPLAGLTAISRVRALVRGGEGVYRSFRTAAAVGQHLVAPHDVPAAMPGGMPAARAAAPSHRRRRKKRATRTAGRKARRR